MNASTTKARERLLQEIIAEVRDTAGFTGRETLAPAVLDALRRVPRHRFVDPQDRAAAYANHPLPIAAGQTISQPFIVALMTDLLDLDPDARVLEVGTGSGYQAAVLGELAAQVYSLEIVAELADTAARRLAELGYDNVHVRRGNGRTGWPEQAPFDAIIVTAAAEAVPDALLAQLAPGGRMVIPVGAAWRGQDLLLLTKDAAGRVHRRLVLAVSFVPLTGRGDAE